MGRNMYRVLAMHELVKHTGSDFDKFSDYKKVREWAIAFGEKKGASYVIISKKAKDRYNHYIEIERIELQTKHNNR